jgi:putative component of toxin-antitoxin plasmid stabilization module
MWSTSRARVLAAVVDRRCRPLRHRTGDATPAGNGVFPVRRALGDAVRFEIADTFERDRD